MRTERRKPNMLVEYFWYSSQSVSASKTAGTAESFSRTSTAHLTFQLCQLPTNLTDELDKKGN